VLSGEENFNLYFGGDPAKLPQAAHLKRYGLIGKPEHAWFKHADRFDVTKEPNEPNRFGWVVEIDPYDPKSVPVKRTALGRFKHEGATTVLSKDGRLVVYSGDDQVFEYVYRFVSRDKVDPARPEANRDLLDHGTLSVARFEDDGSLRWLPLVFGEGPLTAKNGFKSQADVLIETRRAADLLGATPMDRPEDVETNPATGKVYVVLTNNRDRLPKGSPTPKKEVNAPNPRAKNSFGHILELVPAGGDPASAEARWDFFARGGPESTNRALWLACPDNVAFDRRGRMWIASDMGREQEKIRIPDALWAADTEGEGRGVLRALYTGPIGAEITGPCFTPDQRTLFIAIQHPGESETAKYEKPLTRWPDFDPSLPPRPAVVAITREDGGEVGS
jgi:hypothetical protein